MNGGGNRNRRQNLLELESTKELLGFDGFPYVTKLSFVPLIKHWKRKTNSKDRGEFLLAHEIIKRLDGALDFLTPIRDEETLKKHHDFVELIMSGIFPTAHRNRQLAQAQRPFQLGGFYYTPRLLTFLQSDELEFQVGRSAQKVRANSIIRAGCMILNTFYGQELGSDDPYIFTAKMKTGGFSQHFKTQLNFDFVEIKKLKPLKNLSKAQVYELIGDLENLDKWLEYIPITHFEFHGLVSVELIDVTEEESLSRLRHNLLEKDAVIAPGAIDQLEQILRSHFNIDDLRLGIAAMDYPLEHSVPHTYKLRHNLLPIGYDQLIGKHFADSIYEKVCETKEPLLVENLSTFNNLQAIEQALLDDGVQSMVLVPLQGKNGRIIGVLELASSKPYIFNSFSMGKVHKLIPLFQTALWRSRNEINNEIGAIIRKEFTSIHPSVEWRFLEEAFRIMESKENDMGPVKAEPIVFRDVYPLYGQADIVRSSIFRNEAIQEDFKTNFTLILEILEFCLRSKKDSLTKELISEVKMNMKHIAVGVTPDSEHQSLELIRKDIHPYFERLRMQHPAFREKVNEYYEHIDPQIKVVYKKRKEYEQSVGMINNEIVDFLSTEEIRMQKMLPHYFERYKTDGVEYDICIGQSILRKGTFDPMHLETLRMWQLQTMCDITRKIADLQSKLPLKLTTAQLILVHSTPLSISFRMDEKKFDVEGAYNIRYAIIKKRIDKALVMGTNERLTQTGKVAIVFTQEKERDEYWGYCQYLKQKNYISENIEELDIVPLQGVEGLRALRVTVV